MRVLDLFSGIGGFSLGLERAGMTTTAFCEIEPYCQKVLTRHWPDVPVFPDIKQLKGEHVGAIDVICGGFPCQDISSSGRRAGLQGSRSGLWVEAARLIGELRPRYVIVENVAALLYRGLGTVLADLAALGYDAEWHCIHASALGAAHERDRIWIVAYPSGQRPYRLDTCFKKTAATVDCELLARGKTVASSLFPDLARLHAQPGRDVLRGDDGVSAGLDRLGALGNAVVPQIAEWIGHAIIIHDRLISTDC